GGNGAFVPVQQRPTRPRVQHVPTARGRLFVPRDTGAGKGEGRARLPFRDDRMRDLHRLRIRRRERRVPEGHRDDHEGARVDGLYTRVAQEQLLEIRLQVVRCGLLEARVVDRDVVEKRVDIEPRSDSIILTRRQRGEIHWRRREGRYIGKVREQIVRRRVDE